MAQSVQGKTAIVTGAGSGINLAFARLLLEGGTNVILADLRLLPESQALVDKYSGTSTTTAPRAIFQKTNVTIWSELEALFTLAESEFGAASVDIVSPGAGVWESHSSNFWYPPGGPVSKDSPTGNHYNTLDINLIHPIRTTQLAISHFLSASNSPGGKKLNTEPPRPRKTIIHIGSVAGEFALLFPPLYLTSKHGLMGFVRCMADLEALSGIRVVAVAPGMVRTPLLLNDPQALGMMRLEGEGHDMWIEPDQIAQVMLAMVEQDEISSVTPPSATAAAAAAAGGAEGQAAQLVSASESAAGNTAGKIPIAGGTVIEIGAYELRDIPLLNNPGPGGKPGTTIGNVQSIYMDTVDLIKPGWGEKKKKVAPTLSGLGGRAGV